MNVLVIDSNWNFSTCFQSIMPEHQVTNLDLKKLSFKNGQEQILSTKETIGRLLGLIKGSSPDLIFLNPVLGVASKTGCIKGEDVFLAIRKAVEAPIIGTSDICQSFIPNYWGEKDFLNNWMSRRIRTPIPQSRIDALVWNLMNAIETVSRGGTVYIADDISAPTKERHSKLLADRTRQQALAAQRANAQARLRGERWAS